MVSNTHRHDGVCKQAVSSLQDVEASTDIHIPFLLPSSLAENQRLVERHTSVTTVPPLHTCSQSTRRVHTHTHMRAHERERQIGKEAGKESKCSAPWLSEAAHLFVIISLFSWVEGRTGNRSINAFSFSVPLLHRGGAGQEESQSGGE